MDTRMRIGYLQFAPAFLDVETTINQLERLLPEAAAADLLVLPELCNSGYNFSTRGEARDGAEPVQGSAFLSFLTDKCRQYGMDIVTGFNELDGGRLFNSAVLVGAEGVVGLYRKMHLFHREKEFFTPGDIAPSVFDRGQARIGMLVCFDWQFPEVWRILALKGADIICHPANLIIPGFAQKAVPIHALLNRVFVITGNRSGAEGELKFTGGSIIADPRGNLLSHAPEEEPYIGIATIDPLEARNKSVTPLNDVLKDRRPADYQLLVE